MKIQKKESNNIIKVTFWYVVCDFILRGLSLITMPIYTRMMTVGEIGDFSVLTAWVSFFSVTVTLNLASTVVVAKFDFEDQYDQYISSISLLGTISASAFYLIVLPFSNYFSELLGLSSYAFHVMCIHVIFCQSMNILLGEYRAKMEYKKSIMLSFGSSILVTAVSVLCTLKFSDTLKGRIYGTYLVYIAINAMVLIYIVTKGKTFKTQYCKYALKIALPLIVHNFAGNIMNSSDRIMIKKICSSEDAGVYGVAYTCAMFVNMIRNSMNTAWYPWIFERINSGREKDIKRASYAYLLVFGGICVAVILVAPEILLVLGGKAYVRAKYVIPPVVTSYMFSMIYSLYGGIEQYYKKQKWFALFAMICATTNVILNFILIPVFGYVIAAYTTLFSCALESFLHYNNVRKMGMQDLYNTKFNLLLVAGFLFICFGSSLLYEVSVIRYLVIAICIIVICITILKRKKEIGTLLSAIRTH